MGPSNDNSFGIFSSGGNGSEFGANAAGSEMTSSGDIVLNGVSAGVGKSRKGLVIGMIVLVALAIGAMIAVAVVNNMGRQKTYTARESFNRLMNYVVSGEDSTADVTSGYSNGVEYYFDAQRETDNAEVVYAKTSELMNAFLAIYDNDSNKNSFSSNPNSFVSIMSNEKQILDFASMVDVKPIPDIYSVIGVLQANGENGAKTFYASYYDFAKINDNKYASAYKTVFNEYISLQMEIAKIYVDNGCVSGTTIKSGCIDGIGNEALKNTFNEKVSSVRLKRMDVDYYYDISSFFVKRLFSASDIVYNRVVSSRTIRKGVWYV